MATQRVIGVRAGKDCFRYAVIEWDGTSVDWANLRAEHRWLMPKTATEKASQLLAVHHEFNRILDTNAPIDQVVLKIPEYAAKGGFSEAVSHTVAIGSIITLCCACKHVPMRDMLYANMKLSGKTVEKYALSYVSQSAKYWDTKIADAIAAAIKGIGLP